MNEADVKREMIQSVKDAGGYGRRIEDQYAVGVYDTILIPPGLPVFMAEVKIVRSDTFGPTPRQMVELQRVQFAAKVAGHVIPLMIGYKNGVYYFHKPKPVIHCRDCFSVTTSDVPFYKQLVLYYYSQKGLPE